MIKRAKQFASKLGIDSSIFYTLLSRVLQAAGGIISMFFIARFLTKDEQGYFYTFGSILAIQIFFELGFTGVITQFVAHEKAFLYWKSETILFGDLKALSRLSSLLRFSIKWFVILSLILIGMLLLGGFVFFQKFGKNNLNIEWHLPWIIMSCTTGISLISSVILSILEGLGKVSDVAKIRLIQQAAQISILLLMLTLGMKLYSSPIASSIGILIVSFSIYFSSKRDILENLWMNLNKWKVSYKNEIFPYQWRIAISWMSGYFIFQLFNPVVFANEGAQVAGQMGMTLTILSGVQSISLSWINTRVPIFSNLIAEEKYNELDELFKKTTLISSFVIFICLLILVIVIFILKASNLSISTRFLPPYLFSILALTTFINQFIYALATYLRCHKKEPFLINSIVSGLLIGTSTFYFGKKFGVNGIVIGYALITTSVVLVWSVNIFRTKRKEWHTTKNRF